MARIAVLADIHGNLFALEAVIADLQELGVDEVVVAGDMVGRGPQGRGVVERVREEGWACVRGNHEDYLITFFRREIPDAWWVDEEWAASRWMARELDAEAVDFLDSLPFTRHPELDPTMEIFHGSPTSHSEGIGEWTPEALREQHLGSIQGDMLVCAHTHRPLFYEGAGGRIVNVGSVGLPFNSDWRAQYALFEGRAGQWSVEFRKVEYPRESFLSHYETSGFLSDGGVTARLLYREVQHSRPVLVPFLKWAELTGTPPSSASLPAFFEVFDPERPLREFVRYLEDH